MPSNNGSLDDVLTRPEPLAGLPPLDLAGMALVPATEVANDPICVAVKDDGATDNILKAVVWGFAEEQASLKSLREVKGKEGKDTSFISLKRGQILKFMSETLLQKQELQQTDTSFDLKSPKFREVFKIMLQNIADTFDQVKIPGEFKEMFFHQLSKNMEGWEDRAMRAVRAMDMS